MQPVAVLSLCVILLTAAVSSSYHSGAKLRRDGVLNLYPFPRVGRASHTWQVPINEDPEPSKRQLYAFPRVGRDMSLEDLYHYVKRQSYEPHATENLGMWFGPRLGRAYHGDDIEMSQNEAEIEQLESTRSEREKRNTKET